MNAPLVPRWFLRTVAYSGGLLVLAAVAWGLVWILLKVALVTITVLVALLLAALLEPLARLLHRALPTWAAALFSLLFLLGVVGGTGYLLTRRVTGQVDNLGSSLTAAVDAIRHWLVTGPLALQPRQVDQIRAQIVNSITSAMPSGFTLASMVVTGLAAVILALIVLFFLLKDGPGMWQWVVEAAPAGYRERVDEAGRLAWQTTGRYVVGVVVIAVADAVLIGAGLFAVGVPLALSLSVLVFLGAFVPLLGATVSGAVAVLVTLVTNGLVSALIVLGIVLVVQNVEGNLLQPLVQGRAVRLHPTVIIVAVTAGFQLFGIAGAVVAVPVIAVTYRVASYLRHADQTTPAPQPPPDAVQEPHTA